MLVSSANRIISAVGSSSVKMSVEIKLHSARLLSLGYFKLRVMLKEEEGRRKEDTAVAVMVMMMTGAHSVSASFCRATEKLIIGYLWHRDQFLLTPHLTV